MRGLVSLLAFIIAVPASPSGASPESGGEIDPHIQFLPTAMQQEAARFLESLPEHGRLEAMSGTNRQSESAATKRLRLQILELEPGDELALLLHDGRRVKGELADASQDEFSLLVPLERHSDANEGDSTLVLRRGLTTREGFRYEDVAKAELPEDKRWVEPSEARKYEGKEVVVLLLSGDKVQGLLKSVTPVTLSLERDRGERSDYDLDEVASLRKTGMRTSTKVLIGVSIGLGVLFGVIVYVGSGL